MLHARTIKSRLLISIVICISIVIAQSILYVSAAKFDLRRLTINSSTPSVITTHTYDFEITTANSIGSFEFEYCTNDPFPGTACTPPAGFDISGGNLTLQGGETGFTVHANTTANRMVIGRVASVTVPGPVQYVFTNVVNPSTPNQTVYIRMSSFSTDDGSGARVDEGAVAISTSGSLGVAAFVPPYLRFCVGLTVSADCNTVSGSYITLGVVSVNTASSGTSQMAGYTNDDTGYIISTLGTTMTSGNNIIPALSSPTASNPGTSQFGINLRDNTNPNVGQNPTGSGTGAPTVNYNQVNSFKFTSGDTLVSSPLSTESNIFTVSYLVNISANQAPGIYATTLTYIGIANF